MTYLALARKFRPETFSDVTAQSHITDTLRRLEAAGVGMRFIPTMFLPEDARTLLERFTAEVMPAFR
jgi:hypothetical protein